MTPAGQPASIIAVIRFLEGWRILPRCSELQPFATRRSALAAAEEMVRRAERAGRRIELLVHEPFGELCKAYGRGSIGESVGADPAPVIGDLGELRARRRSSTPPALPYAALKMMRPPCFAGADGMPAEGLSRAAANEA